MKASDVAVAFVASPTFGVSATPVALPTRVPPVEHFPFASRAAESQTWKITLPVGVPAPSPVTSAPSVTEPPRANDVDEGVVTIDEVVKSKHSVVAESLAAL